MFLRHVREQLQLGNPEADERKESLDDFARKKTEPAETETNDLFAHLHFLDCLEKLKTHFVFPKVDNISSELT